MQSYECNPDLFSLHAGMGMLEMAPKSTSLHEQDHQNSEQGHYYQKPTDQFDSLMVVDDSSMRCLIPSQGLSLSICNSAPTSLAVHQQMDQIRGAQGHPSRQDGLMQDGRFLAPQHGLIYQQQVLAPQQLRNYKYLLPAQELLWEFCNILPTDSDQKKKRTQGLTITQWEGGQSSSSSPSASATWGLSLQSLDILELQRRKTRLYGMLEEVGRRYSRYCEQMRAVVASFEAVAGEGSAGVYTTLASRAMSRHFRCLRDGIVGQIKATKRAMSENDPVTPGCTRGETPRLKLLDQCIWQQKALHQGGLLQNNPWRPQRGLPERSVSILRAWLFEHFLNPYPTDVDKHILARQTGLSRNQVSNWFINARVRLWKPMVEEMYTEETKEQENDRSFQPNAATPMGIQDTSDKDQCPLSSRRNPNPNANHTHNENQKPDYDSLSSIVHGHHLSQLPRPGTANFGVVDADFSSWHSNNGDDGSRSTTNGTHQRFGSWGAVSLALGLKQHHGRGVATANTSVESNFSPCVPQETMLSRPEQRVDGCQQFQFCPMTMYGDKQNLIPYRNLKGSAQLLRDLAG